MIKYLYGQDLDQFPKLRDTMFSDRAAQFRARLGWSVDVNSEGQERDEYDDLNPLYVIWQRSDGSHGGSMRFLPTTGRTMVNDHFTHLTDGVTIRSPLIWECTRFCLGKGAGANISAALMLGGAEVGQGFHLRDAVGVFDARMVRIYRWLGWPPTILGTRGEGQGAISVGLWDFSENVRPGLLRKAGISSELSRRWFARAFGERPAARAAA